VKEIFILEEVGEKLHYYFSTLGGGGEGLEEEK
jgi:hypothetical protein